jgi:hypothetical protein
MFALRLDGDFEFKVDRIVDAYLQRSQAVLRQEAERIARTRVAEIIGPENLSRVRLTFNGTGLKDMTMQENGPSFLKAKIEEAALTGTA